MRSTVIYYLKDCRCSYSTAAFGIIGIFCTLLPLTIPQLVSAVVITIGYALFQEFRGGNPNRKIGYQDRVHDFPRGIKPGIRRRSALAVRTESEEVPPLPEPRRCSTASTRSSHSEMSFQAGPSQPHKLAVPSGPRFPALRSQFSRMWDKQVDDLLAVISPTSASDRMVKELARSVQQTIRSTFPKAEVVGLSSGDLACRCSLGMAAPEIDLMVSVNPDALPGQLRDRLGRCGTATPAKLDARKVQKSAIRACTQRLVSAGGFKFRRSAFRGQEPKVTLLAPASLTTPFAGKSSFSNDEATAIPVDLSVNTMTPLYSEAVLVSGGRLDSRAKALIVLVRRWARDRGVCHEAKGHLSPYAWSLLAAFFLQVAPDSDHPILPPLEGSRVGNSGAIVQCAPPAVGLPEWTPPGAVSRSSERKSVGTLFAEFVQFYDTEFNWRSEAVSVRAARRAAPDMALPLHITVSSEGVPTQVGPHIQCPFEPKINLGTSMTVEGFVRMREEFSRASQILSRESPEPSLHELIEPWVVPKDAEDAEGDLESMNCSSHRGSEVSILSQHERQSC
jgi:hypothetical protein